MGASGSDKGLRFKFVLGAHDDLAVVVSSPRESPSRTHAGVTYRDEDGKLARLHLGWHEDLHTDEFDRDSCFAIPDIDPVRATAVALLCQLVAETRPVIPYSFHLDLNTRFCTTTGQLLTLGDSFGLTCSHFVVVLFLSAGINLIDLEGWEVRPEDVVRQEMYLRLLERDRRVSGNHVANVRSELGRHPRVRAEEAGGACLEPWTSLPTCYSRCEPNGAYLLRVLAWYSRLHPSLRSSYV